MDPVTPNGSFTNEHHSVSTKTHSATPNGNSDFKSQKKQTFSQHREGNGITLDGDQTPSKRTRQNYVIPGCTDLPFLRSVVDIVINEGLIEAMDRNSKICEWRDPDELTAILQDMKVQPDSATQRQLLDMCHKIVKYSVKTTNPRFFNQLFGGMDQYTLAGAWLTEALNTSQYTYEVAPVFTLMEKEMTTKMLGLAGFPGGEAIFTPGGSLANMYAINLARFVRFPDVKTKGLYALPKPLCLFTSEKGHYSMTKSAATLGLGSDSIFKIKTDTSGKMIPSDLDFQIQQAVAEGYAPIFVAATAGTTVLGAYDPLDEIAEVCNRHKLWLHVDGAWGASVLVSRKHRHLMKGIERADSLAWNPHKMMGATLQCSLFLTKHAGVLKQCHSAQASYLFQQDKHYDPSYDTGDASLQCGRKVDVLKLWMSWKGRGDLGMERDIDHLFMLSCYLADKLRSSPGFRLIAEPECTNVCFYYIPPSLRGQAEGAQWWEAVSKVAPIIKERMMRAGSMMIGYQPDGKFVNFFRMVLSNFDTTTEDMDFLIQEIDRLGSDL